MAEHNEQEERRLAYVALTRAKSLLICSCSVWYGTRTKPSSPSIFIEQLLPLAEGPTPGARSGCGCRTNRRPKPTQPAPNRLRRAGPTTLCRGRRSPGATHAPSTRTRAAKSCRPWPRGCWGRPKPRRRR
ncbi:3'-5' exonuclease [Arthrobacter sp. JCM 19049]|uniref:3'-5' exonuclease n=1 Tax=Arthrobacter sp. JCM 19049 TaxID=1460643 RepID=UPI0024370844|nr:3'-5' exonuclease [Arthrobacter sp. JCM 19049]